MPAFVVIIVGGIIGCAALYKLIEDKNAANAAAAQPNGNIIALEAASDFNPTLELQSQALMVAQGLPFNPTQNPSTASLS